jgi:hypothetical protein
MCALVRARARPLHFSECRYIFLDITISSASRFPARIAIAQERARIDTASPSTSRKSTTPAWYNMHAKAQGWIAEFAPFCIAQTNQSNDADWVSGGVLRWVLLKLGQRWLHLEIHDGGRRGLLMRENKWRYKAEATAQVGREIKSGLEWM